MKNTEKIERLAEEALPEYAIGGHAHRHWIEGYNTALSETKQMKCWSCGKAIPVHENGQPHWHCECGAEIPFKSPSPQPKPHPAQQEVMNEFAVGFANFVGDRPLPEYSKSDNKWRWWDNDKPDYAYATTEELLQLYKSHLSQQPTDGNK